MDRRAELDLRLVVSSVQSACGMELKMRYAAAAPVCSICMATDFIPRAKQNVRPVGLGTAPQTAAEWEHHGIKTLH